LADITSILKTGSAAARVDLTFVAEGYLAADRGKFLADAAQFTEYMFSQENARMNAPFSNFKGYFNVNALFVASNESRWDVQNGVADTYFKATNYLGGRLVFGDTALVNQTLEAALPAGERDITVVLINSKAYGGAGGGSVAWATTGSVNSAEVVLHELGHSLAGLGDEYVELNHADDPVTAPVNMPNLTSNKDAPPWQAWLGYEDELGKVGVYEGGLNHHTGIWRPTENSKMLSLGQAFSAPQKEAFALAYYGAISDYLSLDTSIPGLCLARVPDRAMLSYAWSQDGVALANGSSYCYDVYAAGKYQAGASLTLATVDASGLIRTGLANTKQTETVQVTGSQVGKTGATASITQGGSVFSFDGGDNTITVRSGVTGAYIDGGGGAYIDGGGGADTVVLAAPQAAMKLEQLASGTWLLSDASAPVLALRGVEFIRFSDKTQTLLEAVAGTGGNDMLKNRPASEMIDGGAGRDTLAYAGAYADFTVTRGDSGYTIADKNNGGVDLVSNVERLSFRDASIALDISGAAGQVYRLYQAAFNRTPDSAGLGYWIAAMDKGLTLSEVAGGFVDSAEFTQAYGANPGNAHVIDKLYQNILHRAGEPAGVAFWLDVLDGHKDTLANVLAGFSESEENQAALAGVIGNGFAYTPYG
jgi:hypothetical protein